MAATGNFVALRSYPVSDPPITAAEAAPTTVANSDHNPGKILRSFEVRVKTLTTTGTPTHVTLRVYAVRDGGEVVVLDDIVVPIALAEPKPSRVYYDAYARALSTRVLSLTAGTDPAVTVLDTQVAEV